MPSYDSILPYLKDGFAVRDYSSFLPTENDPFPDLRIYDFMVLGPFVLPTDGAFETEYFYEREKLLDYDYLLLDGGEQNAAAYPGRKQNNPVLGPRTLFWEKGRQKWGCLRFEDEQGACNEAVYLTEQRNCVFYAACYIRCDEESDAVIVHETSGCQLFVNGELADSKPYGRVKGLCGNGYSVRVHFQRGLNFILLKIRPGYIADTMDMSVSNFSLYPVFLSDKRAALTVLQPTAMFFGKNDELRVLMLGYCTAYEPLDELTVRYGTEERMRKESIEKLSAGETRLIRWQLPAAKESLRYRAVFMLPEVESAELPVETLPASGETLSDYCFADFHFDTTYHQEQRTYALGAFYITRCIVDKLHTDRSFKAILSEIDYLHPYVSIYPHHREVIKKAFQSGSAGADCFYNQPNELTSSGEAFVRNLAYGQLYHRDVLGGQTPVYAPGDVFGHPNQLSQICLKGGCKSIQWGKTVLGFDNAFRHISPDGTVAFHNKGVGRAAAPRLGLHHASGGNDVVSTVHAASADGKTSWMKKSRNGTHYALFGEMHDGMLHDIEQAETEGVRKVPLVSRDMTMHHSGTLLTRTDFKQANRLCENLLISAEKFAAIASYYGAIYPDKALDKAWRQVLCAQHHDSVTGTNNEISFVDLMIQYREAAELASDVLSRSCAFIADSVKAQTDQPVYVVFNPHTWERTDVCSMEVPDDIGEGFTLTDSEGRVYTPVIEQAGGKRRASFTCTVPAMGYESFTLNPTEKKQTVQSCGCTIENEYYSVTVEPKLGGGIVSLYDKTENKEVIDITRDDCANRIAVLRELGERMEPQHEIYTTGQKLFSSDYPAEVRGEKCAEYQRLYIRVKLDIIAVIRQEITLYKGVKRVDMKTSVEDYQGKDDLFCLTFPILLKGAGVIFDDRFAPHVFSKSRKKLSFQTHQYASFSHSKIAPVNQWIELGNTTGVKTSFGTFNIGMTAIIRNDALTHEADILLAVLTKRAIPVTPYPDKTRYNGGGLVHFNEDLDNTDTRFVLNVVGKPNEYEDTLLGRLSVEQATEFEARLKNDGFAVLYSKDSDNLYSKPIDVLLIKAQNSFILKKVLSEFSCQIGSNGCFELTDHAILADEPVCRADYGVALINRGNIACSVEGDNLLTMMLFHTADFYGNIGKVTGGEQLIPEQKTHCFSYSLYPHAGDHAEAQVYQTAFAFNDPFLSVKSRGSRKSLPASKSFLQTSDGFVVTAFKAGGYDSAVMKLRPDKNRGFCLRGFETNGRGEEVNIKTGFKLRSVRRTDLLEENGTELPCEVHGVTLDAPSYSIETLVLDAPPPERKLARTALGAIREPVEPTYVRSWEHDKGSMNMGYLSVCAVIGRDVEKISDTVFRFNLHVCNNHPDADITLKLHLSLPEGFTAGRKNFTSVLPAGQSHTHKVTVTKPDASAGGVMRLTYEHDGQVFEDTYEFGSYHPEAEFTLREGGAVLTLRNPYDFPLTGEIDIASPFETWELSGFNPECRMKIPDFMKKYELDALETKDYFFPVNPGTDGMTDAFWLAAKIMTNGKLRFAFVRKKGERHNAWAHELYDVLFGEDKGSIRRLLEM